MHDRILSGATYTLVELEIVKSASSVLSGGKTASLPLCSPYVIPPYIRTSLLEVRVSFLSLHLEAQVSQVDALQYLFTSALL